MIKASVAALLFLASTSLAVLSPDETTFTVCTQATDMNSCLSLNPSKGSKCEWCCYGQSKASGHGVCFNTDQATEMKRLTPNFQCGAGCAKSNVRGAGNHLLEVEDSVSPKKMFEEIKAFFKCGKEEDETSCGETPAGNDPDGPKCIWCSLEQPATEKLCTTEVALEYLQLREYMTCDTTTDNELQFVDTPCLKNSGTDDSQCRGAVYGEYDTPCTWCPSTNAKIGFCLTKDLVKEVEVLGKQLQCPYEDDPVFVVA